MLNELATTLGANRDYLLQANAALQTLPSNATKWVRFERLLEVLSAVDATATQTAVSSSRLRQLLSTDPIVTPQILQGEDPFEDPFTTTVTFFGGSHRVISGGASQAATGLQLVLDAVSSLEAEEQSSYRSEVFTDATILLTLSECACELLGLPRWVEPAFSPRTPLEVPAKARIQAIADCLTFRPIELREILQDTLRDLPGLLVPGRLDLSDHDSLAPTDDRIYLYPLIELGDGSVLLAHPGGVAAALTHRALARAVEQDLSRDLIASLQLELQHSIWRSARRMGWKRLELHKDLMPNPLFGESLFMVDTDKVAHVVGFVDPLDGYRAGQPFGTLDLHQINEEIQARLIEVRTTLRRQQAGLSILHIVCMASLGRNYVLGFEDAAVDDNSMLLLLSEDDLDVISLSEAPDPLGMWRYASTSDNLHRTARVMSFSKLDDYAIYKENDDSFYLSDGARPTFVSITPGSGAKLRVDARRKDDRHAVAHPTENHVLEVHRWTTDGSSPIYESHSRRSRGMRLVELATPCWVIPETGPEDGTTELVDLVAFWLWRSEAWLNTWLAHLLNNHTELVVRVSAEPDMAPLSYVEPIHPIHTWFTCEGSIGGNELSVTFRAGTRARLHGPSNAGERVIASELVAGVARLVGAGDSDMASAIAEALPPEPMKMIQVLSSDDDTLLTLGAAAEPRLIADANIALLLDDVGRFASEELNLPVGPLADASRVLNALVAELFNRLTHSLQTLSPFGLLELLVSEQEGLIQLSARERLMAPAIAACFGDSSSSLSASLRRARDLTATSPANRFLIECASALPPDGEELMSVGRYDWMIAVAKQIIEYGYLSDAIHYGLSATAISMLPSGRIGIGRGDPYHVAVATFSERLSSQALSDARSVFASHWRDSSRPTNDFDSSQLDDAFRAEFQISAHQLALLSGELMNIAVDMPGGVAVQTAKDTIEQLTGTLDLPTEVVTAGVEMLSLSPTSPFPSVTDHYPWRFSRDRSAARRPLTGRKNSEGEMELVWGPRGVHRAGRYILDQLLTGRIKSRSDSMAQYVTAVRQRAGADFNREVATYFRDEGIGEVHENVKRIGELRLQRPDGNDIGDVDVLVAVESARVLLAVEVKDFEFARTAFELVNEVTKLFEGSGSAVKHHEERLEFLRRHTATAVRHLARSTTTDGWRVQGIVLTSTDLLALHFPIVEEIGNKIGLMSFEALKAVGANSIINKRRATRATGRASRARRR